MTDDRKPAVEPTLILPEPAGHGAAAPDLPADLIAGRYERRRLLAEGGMGAVYEGWDRILDRPVAIKVLHDHILSAPALRRFACEAHITGLLEHPSIPPIHDLGTQPDGKPFLVMKLIQGRTLDELIRDPDAHLNTAGILEAISQAVGYAHSRGILHRDLKPMNIMVGSFGEVQVMDWGLAKRVDGADEVAAATADGPERNEDDTRTRAGAVLGSPAYMAPEQANGALDRVSPRSDVFGLGGILCAMLTGRAVFTGENPASTRQLAAHGQVEDAFRRLEATHADPGLLALARRCLAVNPDDRPADGNAVAALVAKLRAEAEQRARSAEIAHKEALVREAEARKRRRIVTQAGLALVAVLSAGIVVSTRQTRRAWDAEAETARQLEAAQKAKREEQAARVKAVEFRDKALGALRETLGDDVERLLGERRDLTANERAYLESIARRWAAFAQQEGTDEATRAVQAEGHYSVAALWQKLGRRDEARAGYERAAAMQAKLMQEKPGETGYRRDLAKTRQNLGVLLHELGDRPAAEKAFLATLALLEPLSDEAPAVPEYRIDRATCHLNLGILLEDQGRRAEAEAQFREALAVAATVDAKHQEHPVFRSMLATAHQDLGSLLANAGRTDEAGAEVRKALAIQQEICADRPEDAAYRSELARLHAAFGKLLQDQGRHTEAEEQYRKGLAIRERLAADYPAVPDHPSNLSASHNNLGNLFSAEHRYAEAEAEFRKDLAIREKLVAAYPGVPGYRLDLAAVHMNLGVVLVDQDKRNAAEEQYRKAMAIQEELVKTFPGVRNHHVILGGSYCNFGNLCRDTGRNEESVDWFAKAVATLEPLWKTDPAEVTARRFLRNSHWGRARALDALERPAAAVADWDRAIALSPDPQKPQLRIERLRSLRDSGRSDDALAEARELASRHAWDATGWYNLACFSADTAARDERLREACARDAVALLRKAVEAGWTDVAALRGDSDFRAIRDREDFRKLADGLAR